MFDWWLGRAGDGARAQDGSECFEAPETPAPVFVLRAVKSAVWGTPAPTEDEIYREADDQKKGDQIVKKNAKTVASKIPSPKKPSGILMTPGTVARRRKNVVFGNEVKDNEGKSAAKRAILRKDISSESSSLEPYTKTRVITSLTRTLENSRQRKTKQTSSDNDDADIPVLRPFLDVGADRDKIKHGVMAQPQRHKAASKKTNQELMHELVSGVEHDGDVTIDLNEPHSKSGKYWKSEFDTQQGLSKERMDKLIKYKQLAKSYAKQKDSEAAELSAKLEEEQCRITKMEARIAELSSRVTEDGTDKDSPELIKELARQTALAVQYRSQVEEFRAAMESDEHLASHVTKKSLPPPPADKALSDTCQELRTAKTQLKEAAALKDEMKNLRQTLATAEKNAMKLQDENTRLTRDLLHSELRLERSQEKMEKQRSSTEEHARKKDEVLRSLQKDYNDLKEQLKSQRRDSEHLLQKRHDQITALRKELALANDSELRVKELQSAFDRTVTEHEQAVAEYSNTTTDIREQERLRRASVNDSKDGTHFRRSQERLSKSRSLTRSRSVHELFQDSQIPIATSSVFRPSKSLAPLRPIHSNTPVGSPALNLDKALPALSERRHNVDSARNHPAFQKHDLVRDTPLYSRTLNPEEPNMDLSSPEPSLLDLPGHPKLERKLQNSPRPSIFNIASASPKPAMIRSHSSDKLSTQRPRGELATRQQVDMDLSRLRHAPSAGTKARPALPPERAAAAKARLEQKNAEKKKFQNSGIGKENIR
ncbi:spindle pole body formation-associated protein-domain-containing protein [Calycina marina]|uniref:Spindle pole body formation-associated protein-domain-containing protein n=1 Tax=Calycina marina TaxID=1763456 RepID=A0A9P8CF55_9HELO|nr:spindle pole body formation-associated protein-domain-containing protein [Calycina marina]